MADKVEATFGPWCDACRGGEHTKCDQQTCGCYQQARATAVAAARALGTTTREDAP